MSTSLSTTTTIQLVGFFVLGLFVLSFWAAQYDEDEAAERAAPLRLVTLQVLPPLCAAQATCSAPVGLRWSLPDAVRIKAAQAQADDVDERAVSWDSELKGSAHQYWQMELSQGFHTLSFTNVLPAAGAKFGQFLLSFRSIMLKFRSSFAQIWFNFCSRLLTVRVDVDPARGQGLP